MDPDSGSTFPENYRNYFQQLNIITLILTSSPSWLMEQTKLCLQYSLFRTFLVREQVFYPVFGIQRGTKV